MATKSLADIVQRLEDAQEIETKFAVWSFYHGLNAGGQDEMGKMYATKVPGVGTKFVQVGRFGDATGGIGKRLEGEKPQGSPEGSGAEGERPMRSPSESMGGGMAGYPFTTPVIEIAGDGKTAKAVLISPAVHTRITEDGEIIPMWHWVKAAYDIVKEDGEWRFWHYRLWEIMSPAYDKSWVDSYVVCQNMPLPDELYRTPNYIYSPVNAQVLEPVPPEPYETFDKNTAYIY